MSRLEVLRSGVLPYLAAAIPLRLASAGTAVAIPVLALEAANDLALGGVLVGLSLAPSVLVAPFAGAALDRSSQPKLLFATAGFVSALAFGLTAFLGDVPLPLIVVMLLLAGAVAPFYMGGLSGVVGDIVTDERRAFAQDSLAYNIAGVAGPGLAAVALAAGSGRAALLGIAEFAAFGSVAMLCLPISRRVRHDASRSVLREIGAGFSALVTHRPLALVTAAGTLSQLGAGAFAIAAVVLSMERTGTTETGAALVTVFAIGAVVGSIATASLTRLDVSPPRVMWIGFTATGCAILLTVPDLGFPFTVVTIAIAGFASAPATAAMLFLRAQHAPPGLRSQVFAVASSLRATAASVGAAVAGVIAGVPAEVLMSLIGAGWILSALFMLRFPAASSVPATAPGGAGIT